MDSACAESLVLEAGYVVLKESDVALDSGRVDDVTSGLDVADDHVGALLSRFSIPPKRMAAPRHNAGVLIYLPRDMLRAPDSRTAILALVLEPRGQLGDA